MPIPSDVQARMSSFFAFMATRGVAVTVEAYGKQVQLGALGRPAGRTTTLLGSFSAYEDLGGGSSEPRQEGQPAEDSTAIYFQPNTFLTPANFPERWVKIPGESTRTYRVTSCQGYGPYVMATLVAGGVADAAGNTR